MCLKGKFVPWTVNREPWSEEIYPVHGTRITGHLSMITMSSSLEQLRQRLALLPGVGPKMAERLALHLLRAPEHEAQALIRSLEEARRQVVFCPVCLTFTEETPCWICADDARDAQLICVVEHPPDVDAIEKTKAFRGRYHVLHGALSPLDGIGPQDLKIAELLKRIAADAPSTSRMPPRDPMTRENREAIRSYVDSLMR